MKTKHSLLILMIALLFSCEGAKEDRTLLDRSIRVNAYIGEMQTRASNTSWDADDAIGIYMVAAGTPLSSGNVLTKNAKYVTSSGDGSFLPATNADKITFPIDGSGVNYISYYPYKTINSSLSYPVNVTDQSSQAAIDLMYSNSGNVFNLASESVNLPFYHKLSKIEVTIKTIDGTPLTDVTATLKGCKIKATFSLVDGSIAPVSTKGDIKMKVATGGAFAEAIVLPAETLSGITLTITNGGYGYVCDLSETANITRFESGYKYSYTLTLDTKKPMNVFSAVISDWTEGPSEEATIAKKFEVYKPVGEGTQEKPYTITDARNLSPLSDVWVRGYIVGYYSGSLSSFTNSPSKPNTEFTALALAISPEETVAANTYPVQLPAGAKRTAVNAGYEANFKKEIKVKGKITDYYSTIGLTSLSEYKFADQ